MRTITSVALSCLLLVACVTTDDDTGSIDLSGIYETAISEFLPETDWRGKDLVYVAGPLSEEWEVNWCPHAPGMEGDNAAPCTAFENNETEPPPPFEVGSPEAEEIASTLSFTEVEFVADPDSVVGEFKDGMMVAPVQNDAGLLVIGTPVVVDNKVYLPLSAHSAGVLFELTRGESGWDVLVISSWIV